MKYPFPHGETDKPSRYIQTCGRARMCETKRRIYGGMSVPFFVLSEVRDDNPEKKNLGMNDRGLLSLISQPIARPISSSRIRGRGERPPITKSSPKDSRGGAAEKARDWRREDQ